jgi:hypothetical protein
MSARLPFPQFEALSAHWARAEHSKYRTLLRLAVARDLARLVHAGISGSLADRVKPGAAPLRAIGAWLEPLRGLAQLDFPFEALLTGDLPRASDPGMSVARAPSARLLQTLGREKLLRYDRAWEAAIAAESDVAGWQLWRGEASIRLQAVGSWNEGVSSRLFPRAIVLYCEKSASSQPADPELWPGSWIAVSDPELGSPETLVPDCAWTQLG